MFNGMRKIYINIEKFLGIGHKSILVNGVIILMIGIRKESNRIFLIDYLNYTTLRGTQDLFT
jgi:hypothetical protein